MPRRLRQVLLVAGGLAVLAVLAPRLTRSLPSRPSSPTEPPAGTAPASPPPRSPASPPGDPALAPAPTSTDTGAGTPRLERAAFSARDRQRGMALGLFAEDVSFDYTPLLTEIVELGATHVALVIPLYQEHGGSTKLGLHTRFSPTLSAIAEAVRSAKRAGLEVTLFPIVRLLAPRKANEWRGTLEPSDVDAWFRSYAELLGDIAAIGAVTGAGRLAVGSELSSLDEDRPRWTKLIERIRAVYGGTLLYSANWDHYRDAGVLDLVDEAGVVAYFDLRRPGGPADLEALTRRWRELRSELGAWRKRRGQPFVITELGYRSRAGSTATPWDEGQGGVPDLEEQRRAFEAFRVAWTGGDPADLAGLYVWNWYGFGGPDTTSYTPRGKPAAEEIKKLYQSM